MINLRYHIVSITAVFLALGIGVALGGTFLDRYTVDVLDRNISSAEERIRDTEDENARLDAEIAAADARDEALIDTGSAELFAGELEALPVLIVSSQGVDGDLLTELRQSLVRADADLRGTLELRDDLDLRDDVDEALAEAVGEDPSDPDAVRTAVNGELIDALAAAGEPDPEAEGEPDAGGTPGGPTATTGPTTTTTTPGAPSGGGADEDEDDAGPDGTQPEIVTTLLELDLLRLTPGPGLTEDDPILEQRGYRYVFVGGPGLDPSATRVMASLLPTPARDGLPAVVVSASVPVDAGDEEPTATIVEAVRANDERAAVYSTVDDVEHFTGLSSTILVLRDLGTAETGHYGQAPGASAVLPGAT